MHVEEASETLTKSLMRIKYNIDKGTLKMYSVFFHKSVLFSIFFLNIFKRHLFYLFIYGILKKIFIIKNGHDTVLIPCLFGHDCDTIILKYLAFICISAQKFRISKIF